MGAIAQRLSQRRWESGEVRERSFPSAVFGPAHFSTFPRERHCPQPSEAESKQLRRGMERLCIYDYDLRAFAAGSADAVFTPLR